MPKAFHVALPAQIQRLSILKLVFFFFFLIQSTFQKINLFILDFEECKVIRKF